MNDDGTEAMPLRELVEYERYLEWRDTSCPTTRCALSAAELVDSIERTLPMRIWPPADEAAV